MIVIVQELFNIFFIFYIIQNLKETCKVYFEFLIEKSSFFLTFFFFLLLLELTMLNVAALS